MQINFFVDGQRRAPQELLEHWFALGDVAAAAASAGAHVTVVQASLTPGELTRDGVDYFFIAPDSPGTPLTQSKSFAALLRARTPDVLHVHGLGFAPEVLGLRALAPNVPILLQDHADRAPPFWRRGLWRRGVAAANAVSFCALSQALPFQRAGLLPAGLQVVEIPESTSAFVPGDRAAARDATGLRGDPGVLWVGHLDPNKDPLTVLAGVGAAARSLPGLELWCCFASAPLFSVVKSRIDRDPELRDRVHLLGRVPRSHVEQLMRAADLFVLGSHREGSSFSLIEALATGLTPVVTDIPSLRALTGNGTIGRLWPCADWRALGDALAAAAAALGPETRARVRAHFDAELSSAALGRKITAAYRELLSPATALTRLPA
jgi:glycosyltransferase involved in cell wall biosynthesis